MKRRTMIAAGSALLSTAVVGSVVAAEAPGSPLRRGAVRVRTLDFSSPADNLYALVKTLGDLRGVQTYTISYGQIFGAVGNELALPLFAFKAARVQSFQPRGAEAWETRFRGMIYFCDLETGGVIDSWKNPYTGRTVPVIHWATLGESGYTYTTRGLVARSTFRGEFGADKRDKPLVLPWVVNGEDVWLTLDERVKYVRASDGALRSDNAINRYQTSLGELQDANFSSARCFTSWHTDQNWMPWMDMDSYPGRLMWGGAGRKYAGLEQMPADFVAEVERRVPGALSKPLSRD